MPEFHVDVADVLHGGEDGGEGGQLVCQARLVPAVYGLADPVLPQLDVDHVEATAHGEGLLEQVITVFGAKSRQNTNVLAG